jgi:hypothetical protein
LDSNSLTKTKNWSGRNEVTETSGRLHPLWPQNKWLHTPRATDYRHTGQDRQIQTELASPLAKNAIKPNPFEIVPLQTTRKENNWKTEEALERAAVTLETERIKGSSPWCLWWWWWWWWFHSKIVPSIRECGKKLKSHTGHILQYCACPLHAGYLRLQMHTQVV